MPLRHRVALAIAALMASTLIYQVIRENPGYIDSGGVTFAAPNGSRSMFQNMRSLQAVEEVTAWYMMGSQGERQVRAAGGTAPYTVAMLNKYNEEFPDYSRPYITITVISHFPQAAQQTFRAALSVLRTATATLQEQAGATPRSEVKAILAVEPPGPVAQGGSHRRSYASSAILTIIGTCVIVRAIDGRRRRSTAGRAGDRGRAGTL